MKEVTRVLTLQITLIGKTDKPITADKEQWAKEQAQIVKDDRGADDVVVLGVQDFVRDVEEGGE